jgi:tRNA-Thr(GGU) m(6)t(6)A37 methyltransferase TsaA
MRRGPIAATSRWGHRIVTELIIEPVGYVRSSHTLAENDRWGPEISAIELTPRFGPESLHGLAEFSHLEVIFHFHRIEPASVVAGARHPRNNQAWPLTGIFAQRGSARPNRLGSTICRLVRLEGTTVHVSGLDAFNGTPVVDIKPVMQEFLPRSPVLQPGWSHEVMKHYWADQ